MSAARRLALTLVAAVLGGWLAAILGVPLPWVLGSMAGVAAVGLVGVSLVELSPSRQFTTSATSTSDGDRISW